MSISSPRKKFSPGTEIMFITRLLYLLKGVHGAQGRPSGLQRGAATFLGGIEFHLHLFDIQHLLLQLSPAFGDFFQETIELPAVAARVVHIDELLALGQGKTDALAAQDELHRYQVARGINPLLASTRGHHHALLFIEAQRSGRNVQQLRNVGNTVGIAHEDIPWRFTLT
jgi:hypothetical protein